MLRAHFRERRLVWDVPSHQPRVPRTLGLWLCCFRPIPCVFRESLRRFREEPFRGELISKFSSEPACHCRRRLPQGRAGTADRLLSVTSGGAARLGPGDPLQECQSLAVAMAVVPSPWPPLGRLCFPSYGGLVLQCTYWKLPGLLQARRDFTSLSATFCWRSKTHSQSRFQVGTARARIPGHVHRRPRWPPTTSRDWDPGGAGAPV